MTVALRTVILAVLVLTAAVADLAHAAPTKVSAVPVLDPASGSYYEWLEMGAGNWNTARRFAEERTFNGRRGRLAVIKSKETYALLRRSFDFTHDTWFGLRYFCSTRTSVWIDGSELRATDFQLWHPRWVRDPTITCFNHSNMSYMPIYMTINTDSVPVVWQTTGQAKFFKGVLVEYPQPAAGR